MVFTSDCFSRHNVLIWRKLYVGKIEKNYDLKSIVFTCWLVGAVFLVKKASRKKKCFTFLMGCLWQATQKSCCFFVVARKWANCAIAPIRFKLFYSTLNKISCFWLVERSSIRALIVLRGSTKMAKKYQKWVFLRKIRVTINWYCFAETRQARNVISR